MKPISHLVTILSFGNIGLWLLAGMITIGSNYYNFNITNFIIGFIFFFMGYFWYMRYKNTKNLINEIQKSRILSLSIETVLRRTLNLELTLIIISLLIILIINSGVGSRVLFEKKSVFG